LASITLPLIMLHRGFLGVNEQSLPIQDEPGGGMDF